MLDRLYTGKTRTSHGLFLFLIDLETQMSQDKICLIPICPQSRLLHKASPCHRGRCPKKLCILTALWHDDQGGHECTMEEDFALIDGPPEVMHRVKHMTNSRGRFRQCSRGQATWYSVQSPPYLFPLFSSALMTMHQRAQIWHSLPSSGQGHTLRK